MHSGLRMKLANLTDGGLIQPNLVADELRTHKVEVAKTLGLPRSALSRTDRIGAQKTQTRLREMIEILNKVEPIMGSPVTAYAWYRSERLPSFGGSTPEQLVKEGHADFVRSYLDRVMDGGFA